MLAVQYKTTGCAWACLTVGAARVALDGYSSYLVGLVVWERPLGSGGSARESSMSRPGHMMHRHRPGPGPHPAGPGRSPLGVLFTALFARNNTLNRYGLPGCRKYRIYGRGFWRRQESARSGMELLEPGVATCSRWRPEVDSRARRGRQGRSLEPDVSAERLTQLRWTFPRKRGSFPLSGTAAAGIHVLTVSLRGIVPPVRRRLEVPSAITLDRLHQVLQEAFGWSGIGRHWFQMACGDFDGSPRPDIRPEDSGDDDTITLARAAGPRDWIGYRYGYRDEWQADIMVEGIWPATPGVTYPRCTKASIARQ